MVVSKKENIKVGILTFHYAHNYGAMLQAFGLKSFLKYSGYSTSIINYVPDYMRLKYFHVAPIRVLLTFKRSIVKSFFRQIPNIKEFNKFESQFLGADFRKPLERQDLKKISSSYDYIIFGSDQIWNVYITKNDASYFADFLDVGKAISYAASCGNATSSDFFRYLVSEFLPRFKRISVREKDTRNVLKQDFGIESECVLDPVFLLSPEYWEDIAELGWMETDQDFILFYSIQDNKKLATECNVYAEANGFKVYSLHGEMNQCNTQSELRSGSGPLEFLYHIKHADCVYTNSFHAVAFSIIFQKKAFVRIHSETGNRVIDLLNECGITWDGKDILEIDGGLCLKRLSKSIERSKKFLLDSIEI